MYYSLYKAPNKHVSHTQFCLSELPHPPAKISSLPSVRGGVYFFWNNPLIRTASDTRANWYNLQFSFFKTLVNKDKLLPMMFLGLRKLGNICWPDTKCFWTKSETFFVSRTQNLCLQQMLRARVNGETFVSATMCPQHLSSNIPPDPMPWSRECTFNFFKTLWFALFPN